MSIPEIELDQAAWQLGHKEYLALQTTDSGYDYTIYNQQFKLMDGGQLDAPELSMNQALDQIMEMHGFGYRNRRAVPYEHVMEQAELASGSV